MGIHNSVAERLKKKIPGLKVFKCGCHIQHLCAKDAIKKLPPIYEQIPHLLYNYTGCPILIDTRKYLVKEGLNQRNARDQDCRILQRKSNASMEKAVKFLKAMFKAINSQKQLHRLAGRVEVFVGNVLQFQKALLSYFQNPINELYHTMIVKLFFKINLVNNTLHYEKALIFKNKEIIRKRNPYFWVHVREYKNDQGEYLFRNIAKFALEFLSFPNSNATSEHCRGILFFEPTIKMLKRYGVGLYNKFEKKRDIKVLTQYKDIKISKYYLKKCQDEEKYFSKIHKRKNYMTKKFIIY
ncbi:hypothetical protein TSAR_006818 [Trichomalopsis sarcophagae]|uniref:Uncharacterized protein n=1 Tax=Trichomalopsis sarcophagae TaxID=543379 RepID=A0A232F2N4_9HYME|nr:hypothetical protein TSAR_006818 [Trichomalopsis sarcophagae]